ncbi:hypothetical protein K9L16_03180 [Candidatus Pacearchaeota archaeon]|nr:hypothetical protein [Candidatus Pacearchaeota archaeon]
MEDGTLNYAILGGVLALYTAGVYISSIISSKKEQKERKNIENKIDSGDSYQLINPD